MAIAPIDLQTMYANMNNVAKTVSNQQQGVHLAQQLQESQIIQQNMERANSVHKAADSEAKSDSINDEGHQSQSGQNQGNNSRNKQEEEPKGCSEIRETYLGKHINIER